MMINKHFLMEVVIHRVQFCVEKAQKKILNHFSSRFNLTLTLFCQFLSHMASSGARHRTYCAR